MHYLSLGESVPATAVADVFGQLLHNHGQNPLKSGQADEDDKLKDSHQQRRTLAETDQHMIISYQHIQQAHLQVCAKSSLRYQSSDKAAEDTTEARVSDNYCSRSSARRGSDTTARHQPPQGGT